MAKVGRRPHIVPTTDWKIRIPVDIAAKIDLICLDPVKGTPAYGARSELVTRLLREYLSTLSSEKGVDKLGEGGDDSISGAVNS